MTTLTMTHFQDTTIHRVTHNHGSGDQNLSVEDDSSNNSSRDPTGRHQTSQD